VFTGALDPSLLSAISSSLDWPATLSTADTVLREGNCGSLENLAGCAVPPLSEELSDSSTPSLCGNGSLAVWRRRAFFQQRSDLAVLFSATVSLQVLGLCANYLGLSLFHSLYRTIFTTLHRVTRFSSPLSFQREHHGGRASGIALDGTPGVKSFSLFGRDLDQVWEEEH